MARPTKAEREAVNAERIDDSMRRECDQCGAETKRKAVFVIDTEWAGTSYVCGTCCKEEGEAAIVQNEYADDVRMASGEYRRNADGKLVSVETLLNAEVWRSDRW